MFGVLLLFGSLLYVNPTFACNGYSLKINKAENCIPDSIIKISDGNAVLDKECNIVLNGCATIEKGFKTAKGKYTVKKSPLPPIEGELNFCEKIADLKSPQVESLANMFGVEKTCPISAKKVCGSPDKKISLGKFKNQLGLAAGGPVDIKLEADHDVGKTCIDLSFTISRAKSG